MGEQFCLKWNNHQSTLISLFDSLLDTQKHADCSISSEGQILNAHKVVLSACSPYLEKLLNQQPDKYPLLVFSDIKYDELRAMLEYMYRGEVNVLQDQLNGFLKAAETLQIKGLADQGGGGGGGEQSGGGGGKRKPNSIPDRQDDLSCQSPATSTPMVGSVKRRRRRASQESDSHIESGNSCDTPQAATMASSSSLVTKPAPLETDRLNASSAPATNVSVPQAKIEPGEMTQPKTEYLEDNNDEQIEDLTMDDDDEDDSFMAKPGTSLATNDNSQGYDAAWQYSGDTANQDMYLSTQQDPIGNQSNSQGK